MFSYKFSIGVPAFKGKYLKECIESILNQTYSNFEVIIVNDASPDGIKEIIGSFSDNRIKYFENSVNIGAENVVDNWNTCLEKAKGEFFILMGDDDMMECDYLETFDDLISKHKDLDIFHCRSKIINEKASPLMLTESWPEYETVYDSLWHRLNSRRHHFISDFVYRTDPLKGNEGFYKLPLAWGSDDISFYRAAGKKGVAHTNKVIFNYRSHVTSITNTGNFNLKMKAVTGEEKWIKAFLVLPPLDKIDEIIYNDLNTHIVKEYIVKKKRSLMKESLKKRASYFFYWLLNKDKYGISLKDVAASILK